MHASVRLFVVAALSFSSIACGDKGDSDPGTGSAGSGGSGGSGSGGSPSAGSAGMAVEPVAQYTFTSDAEGWQVLTGEGASEPATLQEDTVLEFTDAEGNPDPGSIKVTVPFTDALQSVGIVLMPPSPESWDFTGKTLAFKVMLESGLTDDPMNPGGVRAFAKGGEWIWAAGGWVNAGADEIGTWLEPELDFTSPYESEEGYDPAVIRQIGIQILTGGTGMSYTSATLYVDTATVY